MAAQLQNPPPPTFPLSSPSTQAAHHHNNNNPFRPAGVLNPVRSAAHASQNSVSSQHSNPFRTPKHTPHNSDASNSLVFSPVSPIEESSSSRLPATGSQAHKMSSQPRKSADLRKLDGTPYPGQENEADMKPRKVKVAQDMYAGEMPPGYDPDGYQGPPAPKDTKAGQTAPCHKCGGHRRGSSEASAISERSQPAQNIDCHKCGGKRSMPPNSFPRAAMANARAPPPAAAPRASSEAGPSSSSAVAGHRHKCTKCGKAKRPESMPVPPRAGASVQPIPQIQTNGVPLVGINVEPPTTISERAPAMPFSPGSAVGETPLIQQHRHQQQQQQNQGYKKEHKPSRSGSISSLFRSLSRRKKSSDMSRPLPSQQLTDAGEPNPSNFIDKISSAIREGDSAQYSRLRPDDYIERPGSPFSFVDKTQEEQAFEMNDMRKSKQPERRNSWDKADENTQFLATAERPAHTRSQSAHTGIKPVKAQDDVYLALPPDQAPGITRFKSLRSGVNKAANGLSRSASQISRSTSLRRLESVKKVPQLWYRNDMAIEGAQGDYNEYMYG